MLLYLYIEKISQFKNIMSQKKIKKKRKISTMFFQKCIIKGFEELSKTESKKHVLNEVHLLSFILILY